jgi:hypothetical protein
MGVNQDEARRVALEHLKSLQTQESSELVLLENQTTEHDFGWVFFYNTARFTETRDPLSGLAGNASLVVTRADGRLHVTGTAFPLEHYLANFKHYQPRY